LKGREFRQIERDFGSRLLTARNTSEAVTICNEWMAKRLLALASEQQIVATAWFELISDAMKVAAWPGSENDTLIGTTPSSGAFLEKPVIG
jgi:hypothetical protein